ncbi:lytic transglycosylase domain-containing protein [Caulobacter sp. DWR1-3-2b1]|uniref:lytic transglycosylase domain-containing protein n=1 Tax=Caulobacter sp. DWR1-3-2b1 TaxID=2804670 RepID=UPI003CEF22E6
MKFTIVRQVLLAATAAGCLLGGQAAAQVLEIGDEGQVTRFDGPAVFTLDRSEALGASLIAPRSGLSTSALPEEVRVALTLAAADYALDPKLVEAVAWRESRFHHAARSSKGAVGVMQLMPGTARDLGVDPSDMAQNVKGGAMYLRQMLNRFGGDVRLALAAYNAGPGAVLRHGGVPPYAETQAYVTAILGRMANSSANLAALPALGASN